MADADKPSNPACDPAGLRLIADTIETNGGWHIAALKVRAAADEIERLTRERDKYERLFEQAVRDMESCACEWDIDPRTGEPRGEAVGIASLCDAHKEYFQKHWKPDRNITLDVP